MARSERSRQRQEKAAAMRPQRSSTGLPGRGKTAFRLALAARPWHPSRHSERIDPVDKAELAKLEAYLRRTFANHAISVRARMKKTDSAEVYLGEEFIGIIHVDDEDGDRSFNFTMAILDVDLED
jgi:hypothetical protein